MGLGIEEKRVLLVIVLEKFGFLAAGFGSRVPVLRVEGKKGKGGRAREEDELRVGRHLHHQRGVRPRAEAPGPRRRERAQLGVRVRRRHPRRGHPALDRGPLWRRHGRPAPPLPQHLAGRAAVLVILQASAGRSRGLPLQQGPTPR